MADAALSENLKTASLAYEVVRRLLNTKEMICHLGRKYQTQADKAISDEEVLKILETYDAKLCRSGFERTRRLEIIKAWLIGYKRKAGRHIQECGQVHRPGLDEKAVG